MDEANLIKEIQALDTPFWKEIDFWIFLGLAIVSLAASIKAFLEARAAKEAAKEAGTTVKIQTITIELNEIILKLDKLDIDIEFSFARDYLNEINRRVRRLTSPFAEDAEYKSKIETIYSSLTDCKSSLDSVRPIENGEEVVDNAVYHAVESHFADLSGELAELMGLFEKRTIQKD